MTTKAADDFEAIRAGLDRLNEQRAVARDYMTPGVCKLRQMPRGNLQDCFCHKAGPDGIVEFFCLH